MDTTIRELERLRGCAVEDAGPDGERGTAAAMLRREYAASTAAAALSFACDLIEEEVAERFMELPLDAVGRPVRIGDDLVRANGNGLGKVAGVGNGTFFTNHYMAEYRKHYSGEVVHRISDTWERIIEDAILRGYDEPHAEKGGHITKESLVERCKALAEGGAR